MFCANIPEQQSSCKICLENRLFGQKLSLKSLKSETCLGPLAPQKNPKKTTLSGGPYPIKVYPPTAISGCQPD